MNAQVALLINAKGKVERAIHVSTGAGGRTPQGDFRVYRKETMSWSVPFSVWLPLASYFTGGIAFHSYPDVPGYAASHGCVRTPAPEAPVMYAFAKIGTPRTCIRSARPGPRSASLAARRLVPTVARRRDMSRGRRAAALHRGLTPSRLSGVRPQHWTRAEGARIARRARFARVPARSAS